MRHMDRESSESVSSWNDPAYQPQRPGLPENSPAPPAVAPVQPSALVRDQPLYCRLGSRRIRPYRAASPSRPADPFRSLLIAASFLIRPLSRDNTSCVAAANRVATMNSRSNRELRHARRARDMLFLLLIY